MDTKTCNKCKKEKLRTPEFFHRRSDTRDGFNNRCRLCRSAERSKKREGYDRSAEYAKEHLEDRAKNKASKVRELHDWVDTIKEAIPCKDCGQKFPAVCMDFDHVKGEKKMGIAQMIPMAYTRAAIEKEMVKCEIVCANCHRIRTHASDRDRPWYDKIRKYDRGNWGGF